MRARWHWGLGMAGLLLAQTAGAEQAKTPTPRAAPSRTTTDEPEAPRPKPAPREHWYGWQILVSDLASVTLGVASQEELVLGAGYLVGPPLIHVLHGQGTRALASAGMRIGLPLLGYAIASEGGRSCSPGYIGPSGCQIGLFVLGFVVGVSAMGIDPAFAYEPVEPTERPQASLVPRILISDREARFGVAGSF